MANLGNVDLRFVSDTRPTVQGFSASPENFAQTLIANYPLMPMTQVYSATRTSYVTPLVYGSRKAIPTKGQLWPRGDR